MTERITDPEVLADLRRRDATERDRTRSSLVTCECGHHVRHHDQANGTCDECGCEGFARAGGPTWSPPRIVERWPCTDCNALVELTREAIDVHEDFNRLLAKRGERPLPKRIPCADCKARQDELEQRAMRPHEQKAMPLDDPNRRHHP